jgi:hypothetical protein
MGVIADKARDQGLFYRTPFVIRFKGYTDGRIGAYGLDQDALFEIQSKEPLQDGEQIAKKGDRFIFHLKAGPMCGRVRSCQEKPESN